MKEQMKKIALLSLSLILTSAYSVSIVLPSLLQHFSEYTTAQVEILISAPSFAITAMIVLNAWLSRYMKDRPMIVGGLLLLSVSGMVPVFVQEYPVVFASRIFLGIGIGLINAKAISIFSEYYEGREKAALLGYRGSAEVLGSAVMTLVAGKLVLIRWNLAFWVYALGFVIVLLYLVWVPGSMETGQSAGSQSAGAEKESLEAEADGKRECWKKEVLTIAYAVFAGFVICIYCSNSLRVPMLILEKKLGTESEASIILTLMMLIGIGISIVGFFYTVLVTYSFHQISERIPQSSINTATSIVLVGCNLGAACSPFVLKWMGRFSEGVSVPFVGYAGMMGVLGIVLIVVAGRKK